MNIVFVHKNSIFDQYQVLWRCSNVVKAIERTGLHHATLITTSFFVANDDECQKICNAADLIIIHRYGVGQILRQALYWKSLGKKIVLDIDEAINLMPDDMDLFSFWLKGELPYDASSPIEASKKIVPTPIQELTYAVSLMDAVTVSSKRLAGDWEEYGRVWVIQDYIDFDRYLTDKTQNKDELWIGLGGNAISSQAYEQSGLLHALEEVCRMRPQVRLFFGNIPSRMIDGMEIPSFQKVAYSWLPPEDWNLHLAKLDIGLAPAISEYDFRSGRNRVLEYLANRIPWVASDHLPYRELSEFGTLVENASESWQEGIISLVDSLENYKQKADGKSYVYALSQDINENIGKIMNVYESILY